MALLTGNEIIEIATRLEESGEAFYNAAADKATCRWSITNWPSCVSG